jgi:hypothetical protein
VSRFPVAFRPPSLASRVIHPPLGDWAFLAVGLPDTTLCRDPIGVSRSTRTRYDRGGCLLYPGDGGAPSAGQDAPADACRFPAASPSTPPATSHLARFTLTRPKRRFRVIHPSGLPLARNPRMEQGSFGVSLGASNPAVSGDARQGGAGPLSTRPEATHPA